MEDLLVAAFTILGRQVELRYNDAIVRADTQDAVREVLVDAICGTSRATDRELRLARELYAYGSVTVPVGDLVRAGEARAIAALASHFPEPAARALDALVEGWWIYQSWTPGQLDPVVVRHAIDAIADKFITMVAGAPAPI